MSDRQLITGSDAIAELVPASVAYDNHVVPLRILADTLIVASAEPLTTETQQRLHFILNRNVRGVIRSAEWIAIKLHELYDHQPESDDADTGVTWYWPNWYWYDGDQLNVKCSGWEGMSHWTGCHEFPPDHADYDMWRWIVLVPQYHRLVDEKEVPGIRRIWHRYVARCRPTWFCRKGPSGTP